MASGSVNTIYSLQHIHMLSFHVSAPKLYNEYVEFHNDLRELLEEFSLWKPALVLLAQII